MTASPDAQIAPMLGGDGLLALMAWLSPAFPVGGFTYSHGLEWAIEDGSVTDGRALAAWLDGILRHGAGRGDAILFAHAHAATLRRDWRALAEVIELGAALQPSRERHLEASAQGAAFVKAVTESWPMPRFSEALDALAGLGPAPVWTYAPAVGAAAAARGIGLDVALPAFLQAFAANIVSAGVRAIPLGQTEGLRIVAALGPVISELVGAATVAGLDDLGGASLRADIASLKHETQYTRLFRS